MKQMKLYNVKENNYLNNILSFPFLSLLIAVLLLASCKKTKDDVPQPQPETAYHLNVSTTSVQSPSSSGGNTSVSIDANAEWKVSLPAGTNWIELNKTSGTGNDDVQIKITKENTTGAKRGAAAESAPVQIGAERFCQPLVLENAVTLASKDTTQACMM